MTTNTFSDVLQVAMSSNRQFAVGTTCSYVRNEASTGDTATVYRQIQKDGRQTFDTLIWISRISGIPLRQEQDADFGNGQKEPESMIFQCSK